MSTSTADLFFAALGRAGVLMAEIRIDNLRHSYMREPRRPTMTIALKRLSLTWQDGGAYALLGPSGCGKTTLLNLISGLLTPTEGTISFNGRDVSHASPEERNIAQVFQFPVIYDTMTVYDNLAFPLRNRGVPEAEIKTRVTEIAEMLELTSDAVQSRLRPHRRRQAEDLAGPRSGAFRRQCHHVRRAADGHRSAPEVAAPLQAEGTSPAHAGAP